VTAEPAAAASNARAWAALYALLSDAFAYPEGERLDAIRSGALARGLAEWVARLEPPLPVRVAWPALRDAGEDDDSLAAEYTRLFDPGVAAPPCPLYGGLHVGPQKTTMEEVLRFYHHFGLAPSGAGRDTPDHLCAELEFLHVLAFGEAERAARGEDAGSYQRGRRDFLARHPGRWVPMLRARLERERPPPFYAELAALLERCLAADLRELEARCGRAQRERSAGAASPSRF
jgi:DMSO reductase family type II enzyme chaperone